MGLFWLCSYVLTFSAFRHQVLLFAIALFQVLRKPLFAIYFKCSGSLYSPSLYFKCLKRKANEPRMPIPLFGPVACISAGSADYELAHVCADCDCERADMDRKAFVPLTSEGVDNLDG